jgi:hypothetical protein
MAIQARSSWGAANPNGRDRLTSGLKGVAFHYSGADADEQSNHANCARRVRGIQSFHMNNRGWMDIAYNHLACKHGAIYEGRGFGIRSAANGTNDGNSHYFAVCFLGDDSKGRDDLTDAGREALVEIRREYLRRYPGAKFTLGHRDVVSTQCPGNEIYAFLKSHAFAKALKGPERLPGPSPKPAWWWAWANWRLSGRKGPRPAGVPQTIPKWAWQALREWQKSHP